jgi:hypothetical protein
MKCQSFSRSPISPKSQLKTSDKKDEALSANATFVNTDDVVVPPPESFCNAEEAPNDLPEQVVCEPDITSTSSRQPDLV